MTSSTQRTGSRPADGARASRPIARKVLRDDVYDELLDRLLDGEYPPGASLSIEGLARDLGVSPTPVREALVQLEHTRLISRAALKGYRVAPPLSAEQMAELIDARTVVELAALERAAVDAAVFTPELRAAHERHAAVVRSFDHAQGPRSPRAFTADMRKYFDADWEFHAIIMRASGNRYLHQMFDGLSAHVHRLRQVVNHGASDAEAAVAEHAVVLEALSSGDRAGAIRAMRAHLAGVRARATTADGRPV